MKIENEKIIQATEDELYSYWLSRGWDDVYSFPEYMQRMKDAGCEVVAEILQTGFDRITASPEVLAESVVYTYEMAIGGSMFKVYWTSPFVENFYPDKSEAIAATVAKLKEVVE